MKKYLMLIAFVAASSKTTSAADADCYYTLYNAAPESTYYVYNPGYPNNYNEARSCQWYVNGTTPFELSCNMSLPASTNCARDSIAVSASGDLELADAIKYCGTNSFDVTSTGNSLNIVFTSPADTTGGSFLCSLQATSLPSCDCGRHNNSRRKKRVVGGSETGVNEYPMMAGLVDSVNKELYCGATIISPKRVLTAAHCIDNRDLTKVGVVVGEHDTTTGRETNSTKLFRVGKSDIHPSYNSDTDANDIAIVSIIGTMAYSPEVGPACLPFNHASTTFAGAQVIALGWGLLEFGGRKSTTLQKANLDVITMSACQTSYPDVTPRQLCTNTPGKGPCQMDSGGPLLWQDPTTQRLVVVGIISTGDGCAGTTPDVSIRVGAYLDWITSVTPDEKYCMIE